MSLKALTPERQKLAESEIPFAQMLTSKECDRWRFVMDRDDADGSAMLGLSRAARDWPGPDGGDFRGYATRAIRGVWYMAYRAKVAAKRNAVRTESLSFLTDNGVEIQELGREHSFPRIDPLPDVKKAVKKLPTKRHRDIFLRIASGDRGVAQQIAREQGVVHSRVSCIYRQAKARLRELLPAWEAD